MIGTHFSDLLLRMTLVDNTGESYSPLGIKWDSLGTGNYTDVFLVGEMHLSLMSNHDCYVYTSSCAASNLSLKRFARAGKGYSTNASPIAIPMRL